ncbi:UNVERIFIED_CONTAM: Teneurin-1 [Gekko kuhli]
MGNGHQRSVSCTTCNGPSHTSKLFAPVAMASGPDGSIYIGDFNFVRRLLPSGNAVSILELRPTRALQIMNHSLYVLGKLPIQEKIPSH